ncbi:hypothetical protein Ancab_038370 [Ancistrocladus abbreviatus]
MSDEVAKESEVVALRMIPLHFSFAFQFPLQRYLQSQLKTEIIASVDILLSWFLADVIPLGIVGLSIALDVSWGALVFGLLAYTIFGGCPDTWSGFSWEAFSGLWEFIKLSAAAAGDGRYGLPTLTCAVTVIGVPLGIVWGRVFHTGLMGVWAGMMAGGTLLQMLILLVITALCDWDKEVSF